MREGLHKKEDKYLRKDDSVESSVLMNETDILLNNKNPPFKKSKTRIMLNAEEVTNK